MLGMPPWVYAGYVHPGIHSCYTPFVGSPASQPRVGLTVLPVLAVPVLHGFTLLVPVLKEEGSGKRKVVSSHLRK